MKIQDALSQNKAYWVQEKATQERNLANIQGEVQRIAKLIDEADGQITLYDKATEILTSLDPEQVNAVKVEN